MEEMILSYNSIINLEDFKKANRYMFNKYLKKIIITSTIVLIIGILALVLTTNGIIDKFYSFIGYVFIPIGAILLGLMLIIMVISAKNVKIDGEMEYNYRFFADRIEIDFRDTKTNSSSVLNYTDIKSVTVTGDMIYLYLVTNKAYLAKKEENFDELIDNFRNHKTSILIN